ncbi:glyoxalase [Formosimonas limnophila]|uniref:Glyoxalase n=1 Tax=Formosimonas limnophila TaxID=1384487 RepID=A0A8J3CNK3_9BURK|nr:VOC family protein [Formosimonas limnophila]GHA75421.1 glyoxalase [Formosimonas limnophila]
MLKNIDSVVFFVADIDAAAHWYADIFSATVQYENPKYAYIKTASVTVGFHPIDAKSSGGVGGTTVYWRVDDVSAVMDALIERGAQRQRGPYVTDLDETTAIVIDPFGCTLGLIS